MYPSANPAHAYFDSLHDEEQEPICNKMFDWSWDNFKPTKELLQTMVHEESLLYHPDVKEVKETVGSKKPKETRDLGYGSKYRFYH